MMNGKRQERRLAQNRTAQRLFRERRRNYVHELEEKVASLQNLEEQITSSQQRISELEDTINRISTENYLLKQTFTTNVHNHLDRKAAVVPPTRQEEALLRPESDPLLTFSLSQTTLLKLSTDSILDTDLTLENPLCLLDNPPSPSLSAPPCPSSRKMRSSRDISRRLCDDFFSHYQ